MPVTSLNDTRILIPRVRRAIEGPDSVSGSAAIAAGNLHDDQVNAIIADAIASVIFLSGGTVFGHTLNVVERDPDYLAPVAWSIDPELSEAEATVIVAQAALDYFFSYAKDLKTSERIADEGQEWQWNKSAQVISDWIKHLIAQRDRALDQLTQAGLETSDAWINFIGVRDAQTQAIIEPWVAGGPGGMQTDPDYRFGTWW